MGDDGIPKWVGNQRQQSALSKRQDFAYRIDSTFVQYLRRIVDGEHGVNDIGTPPERKMLPFLGVRKLAGKIRCPQLRSNTIE